MSLAQHEKERIALRYWLLGRNYLAAAKAMQQAETLHSGFRKDGVTPEFAHQIWIANYLRTLPIPEQFLETLLIAAFFHDSAEDCDFPFEEIERNYGHDAGRLVRAMTKVYRGVKVPEATYFLGLENDPLAALGKGVDRLHNLSSMVGVFTRVKQEGYIDESETWHLPMIKKAQRKGPELEAAFENVKQNLRSRIALIRAIHEAEDQACARN